MQLSLKILLSFVLLFTIYIDVNSQNEPVPIVISKEKAIIDGKTYFLHTVKHGETMYSICKAYNITQKDLVAVNPDAANSIKLGQVLKIPSDQLTNLPASLNSENYIFHIVEEGQTINTIAEKYSITKEELFKHNPEAEISSLQAGQVIKIPKNALKSEGSTGTSTASYSDHKVKRKETLYSISRIYQISVDDIIAANPELNTSDIKPGQNIKIPNGKRTDVIENKIASSGPVDTVSEKPVAFAPCDLQKTDRVHHVAFLLPLYLDENKTILEIDSINDNKASDDKLIFARSKNLLEFYEGALIALDSLKKAGNSYKIYVYDTGRDVKKLNSILNRSEMAEMELMIGPFDSLLLTKALDFAKQRNIKVVSPLSQNTNLLRGNPQLFQINPAESSKIDGAIQYLNSQKNKNIILYKSSRPADKELFKLFEEKLNSLKTEGFQFKTYTSNKEGSLNSKLVADKENLVIMPSNEETAVSDLLRNLNYIHGNYNISVFGVPKWTTFSSTDISYLHNLQYEYYTSFFADYSKPIVKQFILKMRENYKTEPDAQSFSSQGYNYSFLGYDITFYFLNALTKFGKDFENCLPTYQADLLQSDFHFVPVQNGDGTMNHVINIVRYNKDYSITKIH